jgi:DNA polymerase-3 subunit epsilon
MLNNLIVLSTRRYYRRRCADGAMAQFLSKPLPTVHLAFENTSFLVCDIETTSLSSADGEIVGIGWVVVENGVIDLSSAKHYFIKLKQGVGQSAVFHHIGDDKSSQGISIIKAMERFLMAASHRVVVFHNANLDMSFLSKACSSLYGVPFLALVVDTLLLEKKKLLRHSEVIENGALRLFNCRRRYGLPDYPLHDALIDAIATAELLVAHGTCRGGTVRLKDL